MLAFLFLLSIVPSAFSNTTTPAASDGLTPHSPVGGLSESRHLFPGLFSRQDVQCIDPGYAQCLGTVRCCPAGGSCCMQNPGNIVLGCCYAGQLCAVTQSGQLGCCTPGVDCESSNGSGPPASPTASPSSNGPSPPSRQSSNASGPPRAVPLYLLLCTVASSSVVMFLS